MHPIFCFTAACLLSMLSLTAHANRGIDETLEVTGGKLLIDWRGEFTAEQRDKVRDWLTAVAGTVRLLHGELPRSEIRIALEPYPSGSAVPFARVLRNEPEGVLFYINPDQPLAEFISDWTAYHELSHLFIPYPGRPDVWFSEGLASYYQNILQYRGGLLTADEAVAKLQAGFERGRNDDADSDLTLVELSTVMLERRAFMRCYWSGALYFLEADVRLRAEAPNSDHPRSIDAVLRDFGECCLTTGRDWTGSELAAEFDRIAGTELFLPLYRDYEQSRAIPAWEPVLTAAEMDSILEPDFRPASEPVQ